MFPLTSGIKSNHLILTNKINSSLPLSNELSANVSPSRKKRNLTKCGILFNITDYFVQVIDAYPVTTHSLILNFSSASFLLEIEPESISPSSTWCSCCVPYVFPMSLMFLSVFVCSWTCFLHFWLCSFYSRSCMCSWVCFYYSLFCLIENII